METKVIFQDNDVQRVVFHYNKSKFLHIYKQKNMEIFIYTLANPITKEVRYVGKTNNLKVRFWHHLKTKKNTHSSSWIKSLKNQGLKPEMEILEKCDLSNWEFLEKYWISQFKAWGFNLTNLTDGGEGMCGYSHTDIAKEKMSYARKGKSTIWSIGRIPWNKDRVYSEEERKKMSEDQMDKKHSDATKQKFSELRLGVPHNEEWNKNISKALSKVQLGKKRGKYKDSELRDNAIREYKKTKQGIEDTLKAAEKRRKYNRPSYEQMLQDYNELGTHKKMAEKYGIKSEVTIRDWFKFYKKYNNE